MIILQKKSCTTLLSENYKGKVFELAGDNAYSLSDLAAEISSQTGKELPYRNMQEEDYAKILESFDLPKPFAQAIASWDISASKGDLFDESGELSKLIGRPTTQLKESVKSAL